MADEIISQQEFYDDFKIEVQAQNPALTDFTEGSQLDVIGGVVSTAGNEFSKIVIDAFKKTFFDTADGPEITGGPDDLQTLAIDHFGNDFARPGAQKAQGIVTFSRPTTGAGNVTIPAGTIVKTLVDANGQVQRYTTLLAVLMTGLTINASAEAVVAGLAGNVDLNKITIIESVLTDNTITVNNPLGMVGGLEILDDAAYRDFIKLKIETIRGATLEAIEAAAKTIPGVVTATGIEEEQVVIGWDIATSTPILPFFRIPRAKLYIADANGSADPGLIAIVQAKVDTVRAAGVRVDVIGAAAVFINWTASLSLNPLGPNFVELSVDPTKIKDSMKAYIAGLPIGTGFIRADARLAILAIWGPSGTNDLVDFINDAPVGDIAATPVEKFVPGTMTIL